MRAWLTSVAITAVAVNGFASTSTWQRLREQPMREAASLLDRTALLLQGSSSLRRERLGSIEKIAEFRPDDPLRIRAAATALLSIDYTDAGKRHTAWCTAVLVAPDTLLANHHCVYHKAKPFDAAEIWFNYLAPTTADVYPVGAILEADETLDYALLSITLPQEHPASRALPIAAQRQPVPGERVLMIHHAGGDVQQVSRAFCRILVDQPADKTQIQHSCPMAGGASGSLLVAESDGAMLGLNHSVNSAKMIGFATSFSAILAKSLRLRAIWATK